MRSSKWRLRAALNGVGALFNLDHAQRHYYESHKTINPTGIVPLGPSLENWTSPHGRESLGGSPFAPGATASGPVRDDERVDPDHTPLAS